MLSKIKRIFVLVMVAALALVLIGCKGPEDETPDTGTIIQEQLQAFTSHFDAEYEEDFFLPSIAEGFEASWTSSSSAVEINGSTATVVRPHGEDEQVTLTCTVTKDGVSKQQTYTITIKALAIPGEINIVTTIANNVFVADETEEGKYLLVIDKSTTLTVDIAGSEELVSEVKWSISKGSKYAEISEDGVLTAKAYGEVTVKAQSVAAGADGKKAEDTIVVEIIEDVNPRKVLLNNKKIIEESIPRFIDADYTFPEAENKNVKVSYADALGNEIWDGAYEWVEGADRTETIYCTLEYKGEQTEFEFTINVVTDKENNEFLALDYAKAQLDAIFGVYQGANAEKVASNFVVPEFFGADEALFDVNVSYDKETTYNPAPITFQSLPVSEEEDAAEELNLVYTKPNDDASVTLILYCTTANNGLVVRYNVKAAGYTQAEIIEYLQANTLPQAVDGIYSTTGSHVTLPTADSTGKFGQLNIEWVSDNEEVLTSAGKFANPYLEEQANAKLTATINYLGTVDSTFAFSEEIEFDFVVNPAANKAQAIALELSNYLEIPEFLDKISWFPFGDLEREGGNVMPLYKTVGEAVAAYKEATGITDDLMAEYADIEIKWTASEEGLLDENYKLLKQYLRYHEAVLSYEVTDGTDTATNEIVINVGLAEKKNTIYIGGNFYQQSGGGIHTGDALSHLSKFDESVGTLTSGAQKWGFSYGHGEFGGYTYYIDETDEETGVTTRYQFYSTMATIVTLNEVYTMNKETGDFELDREANAMVTGGVEEGTPAKSGSWGGNWAIFFRNTTSETVYVPMSPYTGGPSPFVDADGAEVKWTANQLFGRENAFAFDGYRNGFVADSEGNVIFGNGGGFFQQICDNDKDGVQSLEDLYVAIPAGGYGMTFKTQNQNYDLTGRYCEVGVNLNIKYYDPFTLSPDGNTEGLGELVH